MYRSDKIFSALISGLLIGLCFAGAADAVAGEIYLIEISTATNQLMLYEDAAVIKTYPVATGKKSSPTPEGTFTLCMKISKPGWKKIPGGHPNNPLGAMWLGLSVNGDNGRRYGIHGTNQPKSIGKYISDGCIRMLNADVVELSHRVKEGTAVWIHRNKSDGRWQGDPTYGIQPFTGQLQVKVNSANVRTGPSKGAPIIIRAGKGRLFAATGVVKDWYRISLPQDKIGFLHSSVCSALPNQEPGDAEDC